MAATWRSPAAHRFTSDDFEVVLFEGSNPLRYAWYMLEWPPSVSSDARRPDDPRAPRRILTAAPVQIDGEYLGRQAVSIEIVPGALTAAASSRHG